MHLLTNAHFLVQGALKNCKEPDDVLQSQIWRFAGQLLLDVPKLPSAVVTGCSQFGGHRAICSRFCQQPSEAGQWASSSRPPGLGRNQSDCSDLASAAAVPDCTAGEHKWSPALQCFHSWDQQGQASMPSGASNDGMQALSARAVVVSRPPVNGVQIVYPGKAYWCKWEGRCDVTFEPSVWLHTDWLPRQL